MDWTTIIVTTVTTVGSVLLAWLTLRGKLAELGKTATEAAHKAEEAATASHKTEQSINNRDSPASDRWDLIHTDVRKIQEDVRKIQDSQIEQGDVLAEHGKDIKGIRDSNLQTRSDIGSLRGEDRAGREDTQRLRQDFTAHVAETRPMMPMLAALYEEYVQKKRSSPK